MNLTEIFEMEHVKLLLLAFVLIPFLGFVISLFVAEAKENVMSRLASTTIGLQFFLLFGFSVLWFIAGRPIVNVKELLIYGSGDYKFEIDFYFDQVTAVYGIVGGFLVSLITIYSRYYLHREPGYKRFFNTLLFFYFGYTVAVFSGNLETLFFGWEILGITSFLLIAFYRERYIPVRNAAKVYSVYRIGDIGLILAMWLSHHLFHENITFFKLLNQNNWVHEHMTEHHWVAWLISVFVLVAAYAKSAQIPFSSWLPRAMEGPTPSSAIFYGSLSVHLGVFLMLRMYPVLEHQHSIRIAMVVMGFITSFLAANSARVQSNVKSKIAYSSIAQIGLIFAEIGFGFTDLALVHFAGNAFLRTYQLLISPSVVSYLIKDQFYHFQQSPHSRISWMPKSWMNALYIISLKEWNLEYVMYRLIWKPLKFGGRVFYFLGERHVFLLFIPLLLVAGGIGYFVQLNANANEGMVLIFVLIGLLLGMRSFTEKTHVRMAWWLIALNHIFIAVGISFNEHFTSSHVIFYLSGVLVSVLLGDWVIVKLKKRGERIHLRSFQGHVYEYRILAFVMLLAGLGMTGFPITPTFLGEDLVFTHVHANQWMVAAMVSLSFILDGISMVRIYSRLFLGPHAKTYHEVAFKSS